MDTLSPLRAHRAPGSFELSLGLLSLPLGESSPPGSLPPDGSPDLDSGRMAVARGLSLPSMLSSPD